MPVFVACVDVVIRDPVISSAHGIGQETLGVCLFTLAAYLVTDS